jgi:hypothetical protein
MTVRFAPLAAVAAALLASTVVCVGVAHALAAPHHAGVPAADIPNLRLSPGKARKASVSQICTSGYASHVRNVPSSEKSRVYARYGVRYVPYAHEVDHLVSLEVGGSNDISNLWPEPYAGRWGAHTKDVLENKLHDLVCAGRLSLRSAQTQEARDWVAAYRRYVSRRLPPLPAPTRHGGSGSGGGYYASSYHSAHTIYCADDSAWKSLSSKYLQHFATLAAAKSAHPGYALHRPC